ncbi:MAG: hypothetical protein ACKO03_05385 [Bacteroidota bacterium]
MKKRTVYIIFSILMLCGSQMHVNGQNLNYADVQTMNIWYNQALKSDRQADVRFNFRDIKYKSLLAFRNSNLLINVPLVKKESRGNYATSNFFSATLAGSFDKSNKGVYKNNTGLIGVNYNQRLNTNNLFLSIGFQTSFTNSILNMSGILLPDQFDEYGPIFNISSDPLRSGRSFNWMSVNSGLALSQSTSSHEWYLGASIRHMNRPFTDERKLDQFRLAPTLGIQAGYTVKNDLNQLGIYSITNWKAEAAEYLFGARFSRILDAPSNDGFEGSSLGFGIAFRVRDAIIPNLQLKLNKSTIGFHYDINISGLRAAGYSRQGFELVLSQKIN